MGELRRGVLIGAALAVAAVPAWPVGVSRSPGSGPIARSTGSTFVCVPASEQRFFEARFGLDLADDDVQVAVRVEHVAPATTVDLRSVRTSMDGAQWVFTGKLIDPQRNAFIDGVAMRYSTRDGHFDDTARCRFEDVLMGPWTSAVGHTDVRGGAIVSTPRGSV